MNTLWINRIIDYKNSRLAIDTSLKIIKLKIVKQTQLLAKHKIKCKVSSPDNIKTINQVLLYEARTTKKYWKHFKILLPAWTNFQGRKARNKDVANKLLDIGYHHLSNIISKILLKHNIPVEIGLFHKGNKVKSKPLIYDLMEIFRADLIDREVLKFFRMKKQVLNDLDQLDISILLSRVNKGLDKKHYLKDFKQCHKYKYYMELQILKFIKAVNHKEVFNPIHLPNRNAMSCNNEAIDKI